MDNNADIADLSDPNRAMKLAEKFGQVYDDSWTDSFEILTENKIQKHTAIMFLLEMLQVTLFMHIFIKCINTEILSQRM